MWHFVLYSRPNSRVWPAPENARDAALPLWKSMEGEERVLALIRVRCAISGFDQIWEFGRELQCTTGWPYPAREKRENVHKTSEEMVWRLFVNYFSGRQEIPKFEPSYALDHRLESIQILFSSGEISVSKVQTLHDRVLVLSLRYLLKKFNLTSTLRTAKETNAIDYFANRHQFMAEWCTYS